MFGKGRLLVFAAMAPMAGRMLCLIALLMAYDIACDIACHIACYMVCQIVG